jgi:hypothetical protein
VKIVITKLIQSLLLEKENKALLLGKLQFARNLTVDALIIVVVVPLFEKSKSVTLKLKLLNIYFT